MKAILYPLLLIIVLIIVAFLLFEDLEVYFQEVLNTVKDNKIKFALLSFVILCLDVILPVPSSIVMYFNGLILGVIGGTGLSVISAMIAAVLGYFIGKVSRVPLQKFISVEEQEKGDKLFEKYGPSIIILSRGIPILSESISISSGLRKISFQRFLLFNLLGYIPVCFIYALFGNFYKSDTPFLLVLGAPMLLTLVYWFFGRKLVKA